MRSGRLTSGELLCTLLLCDPDICCNRCRGEVELVEGAERVRVVLPPPQPGTTPFRGDSGKECEISAWWGGVGRLRVQVTGTLESAAGHELLRAEGLCREEH